MTRADRSIDITSLPEVARLVKQVCAAQQPRLLRQGGEDVALLVPVRPRSQKRAKTEADYAAFRAAAGGWRGVVDVDKFLQENYDARSQSSRPPAWLIPT